MTVEKRIVYRNCEYGGVLLLKKDAVYLSGPYEFGKMKIFDLNRKLIFFGLVDSNDFKYSD